MLLRRATADPAVTVGELAGALAAADRTERASKQDEFKTARRKMLKSLSLKPPGAANPPQDVEVEI
jgi:hypothetical protein